MAVVLKGRDAFGHEGHMALVRAPRSLAADHPAAGRSMPKATHFVFLAELLQAFVGRDFSGFDVCASYQFRVTRNSELSSRKRKSRTWRCALSEELVGRGYARPVRLEIASDCPQAITDDADRTISSWRKPTSIAAMARSTSSVRSLIYDRSTARN